MKVQKVDWKKLAVCIALPLAVGGVAALLTAGAMDAYRMLNKPAFSPPGWVFPVAWTVLYILMGWASYRILTADASKEKKRDALILYSLQLAANFFWSLLFFRWELRLTAFFWLFGLWLLIYATIRLFYRVEDLTGDLLLPYLLWTTYAAYLNLGAFLLN
ncbi:MAG: tryptophan-rich sensory protein [Oscillospiraceae bacterium]|nr:tryptophan-rich sensory protein [Oscillospiraceae bacterium]